MEKNDLITSTTQIPGSIQSLELSENLNLNKIPNIKYVCTCVCYTYMGVCMFIYHI